MTGIDAAGATGFRVTGAGWLRGPGFDLLFVLGTCLLAGLPTLVILVHPSAFAPVMLLNMWLLGFHHVVATFTRIAFDRKSFAEYRFLAVGLPPLLFVAVVALGLSQGQWILATIYLYWQAFHYTRQSYGIAMAYARRPENASSVDLQLSRAILYLVPLWGILYRSYQGPPAFLGLEIWFVPVPELLVRVIGAVSGVLIAWWAFRQLQLAREGRLPVSHTLYMCSHIFLFTAGYLLIEDVDLGWLMVNIWHNAQYLLFVWYFNNRRFGERIDPERKFLSTLSQRRNVALYFGACLAISAAGYAAIFALSWWAALQPISLAFLIAQAINYHHYIVDAVVWRGRDVRRTGTTTSGIHVSPPYTGGSYD